MRVLYTKPVLKDLSQGSRIAFARQFRRVSQDYVSDNLGITGECKRRTMTRYEKGERNPKDDRTLEISKILKLYIIYNLFEGNRISCIFPDYGKS